MGKEVGKEWNSRFITFIPFLCGLTSELAFALTTLCEMESNQELLFQQTKEDIVKVLLLQLYHTVICIRSAISGYPPPVREAQLKFVGRSSFCFSVKGIRFEPPEYGYQLRHPEIVLVECKPEEM